MNEITITACPYSDLPKAFEVVEGELDLFFKVRKDNEDISARVLFRTLLPGQIMLRSASVDNLPEITAIPTQGAQFANISKLSEADVQDWIVRWLGSDRAFMEEATYLEPGTVTLEQGGAIAAETVCFARARDGAVYANEPGRDTQPLEGWLPLGPDWHLYVTENTTLEVITINQSLKQGMLKEMVAQVERVTFSQARLMLKEQEEQESDWIEKSIISDVDLVGRASSNIERVFVPGAHVDQDFASDDPLLTCMRRIGRYMSMEIEKPSYVKEDVPAAVYLQYIADSSKIRLRKVRLDGRWWKENNGPLLGFLRKTGEPVTLIPHKDKRYTAVTGSGKSLGVVDKSMVRQFEDVAFTFYRTFQNLNLTFKNIVKFASFGNKDTILLLFVVGVLGGLISIATPVSMNLLFSTVIPSSDVSQLAFLAGGLGALMLGGTLFGLVRALTTLRLQTALNNSIQAALWDRLLRLPVMFFSRYNSGDLAVRANSINEIREILAGSTITVLLGSIFSVFSLILMFTYSAKMAMISLAYVFVVMIISGLFIIKQHKYHKEILAFEGDINSFVFQLISGIAKIKSAAAENRAFHQWSANFNRQQTTIFSMNKLNAGLATFNSVIVLGSVLLLFIGIGFFGVKLDTGKFVGFNSALGQFVGAVSALIMVLPDLLEVRPLYQRVKPILEEETETQSDLPPMEPLGGRMEVSDVCYRYPGAKEDTLSHVSIKANPGDFIALVGFSGSGKSTLLRLMLGFDKPTSGTIYYGNIDMQTRDIPSLRRQIGVILQKSKIYPGSLLENVIGSQPLTAEDAIRALEGAGFKEDLEELPMGIHTIVGEEGSLSGGQKQRVLIARALVGRPRVLFLDEATSALDNRTQKIVSESLAKMQATRIVIAHRLSTVEGADRIYVMDKGRIVEEGAYNELMEKKGRFYELAKRQIA